MNIVESPIAKDLSLMAFEEAVGTIRCQPNQVILYCAHAMVCVAYKIRQHYNCNVQLIPNELMRNNFTWAVMGNDSMFWSPVSA